MGWFKEHTQSSAQRRELRAARGKKGTRAAQANARMDQLIAEQRRTNELLQNVATNKDDAR